jgi:serine/threonine protein kinase
MLTKSGTKLMDFGLARASRQVGRAGEIDVTATAPAGAPKSEEPITAKGTVVGTFQYMAP